MLKSSGVFKHPPQLTTLRGDERVVGFGLEFSGLSLEDAGKALEVSLGGKLRDISAAERELHVDSLGVFRIELDWEFLKRNAANEAENENPGMWVEALTEAAALLVPLEVICPPIALTNLQVLDPMVSALRDAGAVGTEDSLIAAYGVHINAEAPSLEAPVLLAYLKAFTLLQWWLVDAHQVDPTRRISPYIDLYPEAYLKRLLAQNTATNDEIFDDYLEYNASRNRGLDLLPLLAEIDDARVKQVVNDPRIKARPAFHYRLPNCHIEKPYWSLAGAWNIWWVVEQLSYNIDDLNALSREFLERERPVLGVNRSDWVAYMDQWLKDRALV